MRIRPFAALAAPALAAALAGCAAAPFDYRPVSDTPAGPGLFTGDKGKFTLSSAATGGSTGAAAASPEPSGERELEEFRRWKESGKDGADYREFQEWREWKEFRAWKERARPR